MTAPALPHALSLAIDHYAECVRRAPDRGSGGREMLEAAIAAELAKLQTGLAIAESFVRTSTEVLREIEWGGNAWNECCPACRRFADGHAPDCRLAALLQGGR